MTISMPRINRLPAQERGVTIGDFLVPIRISERVHNRVRHIGLVAIGVMLIALSAKIAFVIPGNPVPITGQTFGVLMAGGALGFRRGIAATGIYLLIGILGVPFFALDRTGIEVIWGATGGYLVGFVVAAAIVGRLAEAGWDRSLVGAIGAMLIANAAIYVIAVPWLMAVTGMDLATGIQTGLVPFLLGDAIKLALAAAAFPAAWWFVGRRPGDR
ncbi:MAG TPA: biotin transporter BioY [Candidatus Binatia bacterium]|nr:biotin transporter BioY [Candidatus Binatia bacterium]